MPESFGKRMKSSSVAHFLIRFCRNNVVELSVKEEGFAICVSPRTIWLNIFFCVITRYTLQ